MSIVVQKHLCERGYDVDINDDFGEILIHVKHMVGDQELRLLLIEDEPYSSLPEFLLLNPEKYGKLAHVIPIDFRREKFGSICVNDRDSISVNFARPELAVEESLLRHIALLEKVLSSDEWNKQELLREFYSNWLQICDHREKPIIVACSTHALQCLNVYSPQTDTHFGLESHYLVEPADEDLSPISGLRYSAKNSKRSLIGKAVVIPIEYLRPAPDQTESLQDWYLATIEELPKATKEALKHSYGQWREKRYWVIFTAQTQSSERTWFAIKLTSNVKKSLPVRRENFKTWKIQAKPVRMFSHDNVVRRGGGNPRLYKKRVALVGAGSVGCEIAQKLSAAGVSDLTIFDRDQYSIDNLYRHILPECFIGQSKSAAVTFMLHAQFPWLKASYSTKELLEIDKQSLLSYDLIIIAIGRPTHELLFKQYLLDNDIEIPVINCWLEGFGVGGHAVLDIPESDGCLLCSYVCPDSGMRGLSSNLNFIEQNQNITKNIAGCGEQYISYSAICSSQTAIIATDIAINFLEDKLTESCKVSWKGDDTEAKKEGVFLTHRYYHFDNSLRKMPLLDKDCDVCNG